MHTHTDTYMHTQTHTHRHAHAHTRQRKPSLPPSGRCQTVASAAHSCLPLPTPSLAHTSFFTGLYLLCTHWVRGPATDRHLLATLKCQPHLVELQAPVLVTGTKGRAGRQEGWRGRACVSQQAGGERPLLAGSRLSHLAEQRQWWLLGGPASFPQAEPRVLKCPENSPAGRRPKGAQGGFPGRVERAPGSRLREGRGP